MPTKKKSTHVKFPRTTFPANIWTNSKSATDAYALRSTDSCCKAYRGGVRILEHMSSLPGQYRFHCRRQLKGSTNATGEALSNTGAPKEFEEPVPIVSSPSGSSAELDDSATVAFGGTAFWQLFKLPHRPTLCRRLGA